MGLKILFRHFNFNVPAYFECEFALQIDVTNMCMIWFQMKEYLKDPSKFAAAVTAAAPAEVVEEKKEEKKVESESEDEDDDMGFGLFD